MFAASGSNASMEYVTTKASARVEVLRAVAHDVATYFGVTDPHRQHKEVSVAGDLDALLVDLRAQRVHEFVAGRHIPPPPTRSRKRRPTNAGRETGVRDVLLIGLQKLTRQRLFEYWKKRSGKGGTGIYDGDAEWATTEADEGGGGTAEDDFEAPTGGTAFDEPDGVIDIDVGEDELV